MPMPRRRRWTAPVALALSLLTAGALAGCSSGGAPAGSGPSSASASTASAPAVTASAPSRLDVARFRVAMVTPGTVTLDVRTPQEYAAGHLPGAVNIDVEAPDFGSRIATLDKTKAYAVYCRSGNRSLLALEQMRQAGLTRAVDLEGGVQAYQQAGGRLVTG